MCKDVLCLILLSYMDFVVYFKYITFVFPTRFVNLTICNWCGLVM